MNQNVGTNRRRSDRFAVERDVRFKVTRVKTPWSKNGRNAPAEANVPATGDGKTVNVSSAGVSFTTTERLAPGSDIEVSIDWPVELNNSCALRLVGRGRVVRSLEGEAAVHVQNYEFKTQARAKAKT